MGTKQPTLPYTPITDTRLVGFELNLERNGIFVPRSFDQKSFERTETVKQEDGTLLEMKISVGKHKTQEVGVLYVPTHQLLLLGLIELWEDAGKPKDKILSHTHYTITKQRGKNPKSGRNNEYTEELMHDLRTIPLQFWNTWYVKNKEEYAERIKPFSILNHLDIFKKTTFYGKHKSIKGYMKWRLDRVVTDSLLDTFTHPTISDVLKSIKKHKDTAIPFYQFSDRTLSTVGFSEPITFALPNFWKQATGFSCPEYKRKRDLKARTKAIWSEIETKPLSSGGILEFDIEDNSKKNGYNLSILKKPVTNQPEEEKTHALVERMVSEGFRKRDAQSHAARLESSLIENWLDAIPQMKEQGISKPAGYIHRALEKGDPVAERFIVGSMTHKRSKDSKKTLFEASESEKPAFSEKERKTLDTYFDSFSEDKQVIIRKMALKNMPHHIRAIQSREEDQGNEPLENLMVKGEFEFQLYRLLSSFKVQGAYFPENLD